MSLPATITGTYLADGTTGAYFTGTTFSGIVTFASLTQSYGSGYDYWNAQSPLDCINYCASVAYPDSNLPAIYALIHGPTCACWTTSPATYDVGGVITSTKPCQNDTSHTCGYNTLGYDVYLAPLRKNKVKPYQPLIGLQMIDDSVPLVSYSGCAHFNPASANGLVSTLFNSTQVNVQACALQCLQTTPGDNLYLFISSGSCQCGTASAALGSGLSVALDSLCSTLCPGALTGGTTCGGNDGLSFDKYLINKQINPHNSMVYAQTTQMFNISGVRANRIVSYNHMGCYNSYTFGTTGSVNFYPAYVTPRRCADVCAASTAGYKYAALVNGACQCLLASDFQNSISVTPSTCNAPCLGNTGVACGGSSPLSLDRRDDGDSLQSRSPAGFGASIYSIDNQGGSTLINVGTYQPNNGQNKSVISLNTTFAGCVNVTASAQPRAPLASAIVSTNLTVQSCQYGCYALGLPYSAINNGVTCQCFTASDFQANAMVSTSGAECNVACSGNASYACGGSASSQFLSAYKTTISNPSNATASVNSVVSTYTYSSPSLPYDYSVMSASCWLLNALNTINVTQQSPDQGFAYGAYFPTLTTPQSCVARCERLRISTQTAINTAILRSDDSGTFCTCARSTAVSIATGSESSCNRACTGSPGLSCGGNNAANVYVFVAHETQAAGLSYSFSPSLYTAVGDPSNATGAVTLVPIYLGCVVKSDADISQAPVKNLIIPNISPDSCIKVCWGYGWGFVILSGNTCSCVANSPTPGSDMSCQAPCAGSLATCGSVDGSQASFYTATTTYVTPNVTPQILTQLSSYVNDMRVDASYVDWGFMYPSRTVYDDMFPSFRNMMTVDYCMTTCAQYNHPGNFVYSYFMVGAGSCQCVSRLDGGSLSSTAPSPDPCPGNNTEICPPRVMPLLYALSSPYEAPYFTNPDDPNPSAEFVYQYGGCYHGTQALIAPGFDATYMVTPYDCGYVCGGIGFPAIAMTNGGSCYCINDLSVFDQGPSQNYTCNMPCVSYDRFLCGGPQTKAWDQATGITAWFDVYLGNFSYFETPVINSGNVPAPVIQIPSSSYGTPLVARYTGCYNQSDVEIAGGVSLWFPMLNTAERCVAACDQQYNQQLALNESAAVYAFVSQQSCSCGHAQTLPSNNTGNCEVVSGGSAFETAGDAFSFSAYFLNYTSVAIVDTPALPATFTDLPNGAVWLGCYSNDNSTGLYHPMGSHDQCEVITPQTCASMCFDAGFMFSAVTNGDTCECLLSAAGLIPAFQFPQSCSMFCKDSRAVTCGSEISADVYYFGDNGQVPGDDDSGDWDDDDGGDDDTQTIPGISLNITTPSNSSVITLPTSPSNITNASILASIPSQTRVEVRLPAFNASNATTVSPVSCLTTSSLNFSTVASMNNMTVKTCTNMCLALYPGLNQTFIGLSNSTTCSCGASIDSAVATKNCTYACAGQRSASCGSTVASNVYRADVITLQSPVSVVNATNFNFTASNVSLSLANSTNATASNVTLSTNSTIKANSTISVNSTSSGSQAQILTSFVQDGVTFKYRSCWGEPAIPHALGTRLYPKQKTVEACLQLAVAGGFWVAGLEAGGQCYAETTKQVFGGAVDESYCNTPCGDNPKEICGGNNVLTLYDRLTVKVGKTVQSYNSNGIQWKYQSCWGEPAVGRALPNKLIASGATVESCLDLATKSNYFYAGLEYGGECWASDKAAWGGKVPDNYCATDCTANPLQVCGDNFVLSLYQVSQPTHKTSVSINGQTWKYSSCWGEPRTPDWKVVERALPIPFNIHGSATIESCLKAGQAANLKHCGLEYGSECWCSNNKPKGGAIDESYCAMPCDDPTEACGGNYVLSYYTST